MADGTLPKKRSWMVRWDRRAIPIEAYGYTVTAEGVSFATVAIVERDGVTFEYDNFFSHPVAVMPA